MGSSTLAEGKEDEGNELIHNEEFEANSKLEINKDRNEREIEKKNSWLFTVPEDQKPNCVYTVCNFHNYFLFLT